MTEITLTAANDNPGGTAETRLALVGLVQLLANAEARQRVRGPVSDAAVHEAPANTNHPPKKGDAK